MPATPSPSRTNRRAKAATVVAPTVPQLSPFVPRSRLAAVVAEEEGYEATKTQTVRASVFMAGLCVALGGVCWLVNALLQDRVIAGQWTGGGAAAIAVCVTIWILAPLTPSPKGRAAANPFAAVVVALLVVSVGTALALASRALPGGLALAAVASLVAASAFDLTMARLPVDSALRLVRLFVPIAVAALLLYVSPTTTIGAMLAPIAPLPVGIGAAVAVALLLQDRLGSSAARYRHASADVAGVALTRWTEVSRSLFLLVLDALGFGVEDDVRRTTR